MKDLVIRAFETHPMFEGISPDNCATMTNCLGCIKKTYAKDQIIPAKEVFPRQIGIVISGCVYTVQEDVWGHRNILDILSPGDSCGEVFAASMGSVLNVSVVAEADCQVLLLNINRILSACSNTCSHHAQLIRNLVNVIAGKSLRMHDKINHISKRSTKEKLLSYLSSEADRCGSLSFTIPYNRQQLADYLCVERAAMSVALSQMQKDGILQYSKNKFTLFTYSSD